MSRATTKLLSLALALAIVGLVAIAATPHHEKVISQEASAGTTPSENMSEEVEQTILDWIPTIVMLTMVGIALSAFGINYMMKR